MINNKLTVGITQGDGNGIGYEVIIKALADARILDGFTPVIYGSSKIFGFYRKQIHNLEQLDTYVINSAKDAKVKKINILNCLPDNVYVEPGQATPDSAKSAITALERAVADLKSGDIDVLVTGPINKRAMTNARLRIYRPHGVSETGIRRERRDYVHDQQPVEDRCSHRTHSS